VGQQHNHRVPRLTEPFETAEFRGLWLARGLSLLGDQLARVALSVLVYERTGSAAWTGLVYALTYLPYLAGPLVAGIADRRSRRTVMIVIDLLRAGLVGLMAVRGMPLPVMCLLLVLVTAVSPLYDAARSATLPNILSRELYPTGLAIFSMTTEGAQVLGFACGGLLVAGVGARPALALDALTYLVSGALVIATVRPRRAPASGSRESGLSALRAASGLVFGSPRMRALVSLAWINAFWIVPEGLAAPYAAHLGGGPVAVGILLAAIPCGCTVGAALLTRFADQDKRLQLMGPLALLASAPLLACLLQPGLVVTVALWFVCGLGTAYNVPANSGFVQGLPDLRRAQAISLATTGIVLGQGLAVLVGGLLGGAFSPAAVVGGAGALGVVVVTLLSFTWLRTPQVVDLRDTAAAPAPAPAAAG
jgi:MFS family permease